MSKNRAQWMSVADFLARQNLGLVLQAKFRAEAAGAAGVASAASVAQGASQTLPAGNHGEIVLQGAQA